MKRKWMWFSIAVVVALLATFAVTAGTISLREFGPITGPGWNGWCTACGQQESQSYDYRLNAETRELCAYVVWTADDTRELAHESLLYCSTAKGPFGLRK